MAECDMIASDCTLARKSITSGSQVHFDYDNDGFAERTGWVRLDDGILVHDKNANGLVDGVGELFGMFSADGFEVLALLDSNADGKISALDAKFSDLRIWRELNGDGGGLVEQNPRWSGLSVPGLASHPHVAFVPGVLGSVATS